MIQRFSKQYKRRLSLQSLSPWCQCRSRFYSSASIVSPPRQAAAASTATTATTTAHNSSPPQHIEPRSALPPEFAKADAPYHFYQNKVLEPYLQQTIHASTVRQYIMYGRHMTSSDRLIASANWVRNELLVRLAHRIRDFQQLPFIIGTNPNIEWPYRLYFGAFESLRKTPVIKTEQDNVKFCALLESLLEDGQQVLPRMALGVSECASHYHSNDHTLDRFLNRMMRSRISRRLLAEQHVLLTKACHGNNGTTTDDNDDNNITRRKGLQVGIFNTECSAKAVFDKAQSLVLKQYSSSARLPAIDVHIQGQGDITFAYVPDQLEQILYELLHNAVRYTIQQSQHDLPPVRVTICANKSDVFFRFSDQGGGIPASKYERLWSYQERANNGDFMDFKLMPKMPATLAERFKQQQSTTHRQTVDDEKIAAGNHGTYSLGIGLIMARVYGEYFGGELQVLTMDGYGTDAYVRIPRSGLSLENIGMEPVTRQPSDGQQHHHHHHQQHHEASRVSSKKSTTPVVSDTSSKTSKHHHVLKHTVSVPNHKGWSLSSMISS